MRISLVLLVFFFVISKTNSQTIYKNIVIEGAGLKGIAYAGVVKTLEDENLIATIDKVGGTSAGAMIGLAIALGYNAGEIEKIIGSARFNRFNQSGFVFVGSVFRLNRNFGWYKSKRVSAWLSKLIEKKTGNSDITFEEFKKQGYKELYVTGTSLNRQKTILFSAETYPHMKIKDAVRISMSIPLYFEAIFIDKDGMIYDRYDDKPDLDIMVDGGILNNYPLQIFDFYQKDSLGNTYRIPNPNTLGIRIDPDKQIKYDKDQKGLAPYKIEKFKDILGAFYNVTFETLNRQSLTKDDWDRTISVSSKGIHAKIRRLKPEEKKLLMDSGSKSTYQFLKTTTNNN